MTTQNNTVLAVLSQATNNDGSRKSGVWPTKGHDMLEQGIINAEIDNQGASINGKHVSTSVLTAKALQPVFEGGETLAQWLAYTASGFVSFQQQRAATGIVPSTAKVTKEVDIDLLSSDELEQYYLSQLKPVKPDLLALLTVINDDSVDITIRIDDANSVVAALKEYKKELSVKRTLSDEQLATLANKRAAEACLVELAQFTYKIDRTKTGLVVSFDAYSKDIWLAIVSWAEAYGFVKPVKQLIRMTDDDTASFSLIKSNK